MVYKLTFLPFYFIAVLDYAPVPINTVLSFSAGMTTASFDISLVNDGFVEGDETFTVRLAFITSVTNIMFVPSDTATVTILDADSE